MRKAVLAIIPLLLFALACSCTSSETQVANPEIDALFTAWDKTDSPGCGLGVSREGSVIYERGYGMASLERGLPITPSTVFPLASITKAFTAMSILIADQQGLLALDDEVSKYIPEWSIREPRVTIRHLLTHTSGLRDAYVLLGWTPAGGGSNETIVNILSRQRGLNFEPGTEYQYNNGGYNMLGTILERATGLSLAAFAETHIFKPLGMTSAFFSGEATDTEGNRASGYSPQATGWSLVPESSSYGGNAGMVSSVRDLLLWADNFSQPRVGTPAVLAEMQTPTLLSGGQPTSHGMGLAIGSYRGIRTISISGGDLGMATKLTLYPDPKLAIVVLCNMDSVVMGGLANVNVDDLTDGVARVFLGDSLTEENSPNATAPLPQPTSPPANELAQMTGIYRVPDSENHFVSMSVRDGGLNMRDYFVDNYDMLMTPVGGARFAVPGATVEFSPAAAGRPKAWHVVDTSGQRLFEIPSIQHDISPADLAPYAGTYRSEELDVTYAVAAHDGTLVVHKSKMFPVFKDGFVGEYVGTVRFSRDAKGRVSGFTLNRYAARGVVFQRVN